MPLIAATRRNIEPTTGLGGFDLTIVPGDNSFNYLDVTIRVYMVDKRNNPSSSLDDYFSSWRHRVGEHWNDRFEFMSKDRESIRVRFNLQRVNTQGACHFPVELLDGYAQYSGLKFPSEKSDPFNGSAYLTLMDQDNLPYCIASASNLLSGNVPINSRTAAMVDARNTVVGAAPGGQAIFDVPMLKVGTTWTVDPAIQVALDGFCTALTNTPNWLVPPPIVIHASSGSESKANAVTSALMNYIRQRGVMAKIGTDVVKTSKRFKLPFTASATTMVVRVEVEGVSEMYKQWKSDYVVSSHEFGHLIGLPDEYLDYSTMSNMTIRQSQPLWDSLCVLAAVPTRNWKAQSNDSLMSLGTRLYPAHATTIWMALDSLTQDSPNRMAANSWRIVKP